ncbi:hypothetical protein [Pseudomonas putida]|uniref:hypothetical protein n=1 Tax=Pseudomonas putida TaxID=303 RepID=UPI001E650769|nr:hypothetical protein [Pseudomonas putida]MCE0958737.1 hypothetical protein [Pseudomonas putida]
MKRILLSIGAISVFLCMLALALWLLLTSKFSGAEFTAFVLAFALIGMAILFAPEIQEISIAGNFVKLKEVKADAMLVIESLQKSRNEAHRALIKLSLKTSGMFGSTSPVDPRVPEFLRLVKLSEEYGCVDELKSEILSGLELLLRVQLQLITWRNRKFTAEGTPPPFDVAETAFDMEGISEAANARTPTPELAAYKAEIKQSLEAYSTLYTLRSRLSVG